MNILILTYVQQTVEQWQKHVLDYIVAWQEDKQVNITMLFVQPAGCEPVDLYKLARSSVELHVLKLEGDTQIVPLCISEVLETVNSSYIGNKIKAVVDEKDFDLIQADSIIFAPYLAEIKMLTNAVLVLKPAFVESQKLEALSSIPKFSFLKRIQFNRYVAKVKELENRYASLFDYLIVSDTNVFNYFYSKGLKECYFIANSSVLNEPLPQLEFSRPLKLFYAGCLRNKSVMRSLLWFLNDVWKSLLLLDHTIELHVAGEAPSWFASLLNKRLGVFYDGDEYDVAKYIEDKHILLLPYDKSLGITPEIMAALQGGKAVLANPLAVRDLEVTPMFHYMPARTAGAYQRLVERVLKNPQTLSDSASEIIKFSKDALMKDFLPKILLNFYRQIIKPKSRQNHE